MIKQLKTDFRYAIYSGLGILILLLFVISTVLIFFLNDQKARSEIMVFQQTVEQVEKYGEDVEAAMQKDYEIMQSDSDSQVIRNPLAYYREELGKFIYMQKTEYTFTQFCEGIFSFLPILSAFFGFAWLSCELKHKTFRLKVLRCGKQKMIISRQLSGFLILAVILCLTIPVAYGLQAVFSSKIQSDHSSVFSSFPMVSVLTASTWKKTAVILFRTLFYYELGFTFCNLLNGNPISIILICIYLFFVPTLFRYDISNAFNNIASEIFAFAGAFQLKPIMELPVLCSWIELTGILIALIAVNSIWVQKKSAYIA